MDIDDLEPRKMPAKPKDLGPMSVAELDAYIATLEAEIERARAAIAGKRSQRGAADAFFKR